MYIEDAISEESKQLLCEYVEAGTEIHEANPDIVLKYYYKNKGTLFKALGKQTKVKIPICINKTPDAFRKELQAIYKPPYLFEDKWVDPDNHPFIKELEKYLSNLLEEDDFCIFYNHNINFTVLKKIFGYSQVQENRIDKDINMEYMRKIFKNDKIRDIQKNSKTMKTIRRFLKSIDFPHMELFERWRCKISDVTTSLSVKGKLVLSIDPIDFFTLSDNNCGWTSCFNWLDKGCYSSSNMELLNSDIIMIAYLESDKEFLFNNKKLPNKSWRSLVYVHKDIIIAGKGYPYNNENLSKEVVLQVKNLVSKNLKWNYYYDIEEYLDMKALNYNKDAVNFSYDYFYRDKKKILFYTYSTYNDLVEDNSTKFWCVRNPVPHTIGICISGPHHCLNCGTNMTNWELYDEESLVYEDGDYPSTHDYRICEECYGDSCYNCNTIYNDDSTFTVNIYRHSRMRDYIDTRIICKNCFSDYWYCEELDCLVNKRYLKELITAKKNIPFNTTKLIQATEIERTKWMKNIQ